MWPGNSLVDWVAWDPYGATDTDTFTGKIGVFYDELTELSDSTHNYLSKPWGLGEFSSHGMTPANTYRYWDEGKAAIAANYFPKLKMYTVFDSPSGAELDN